MSDVYEEDDVLNEYLLFHYARADDVLPDGIDWPSGMREALDFAVRTPSQFSKGLAQRGLDLGCAVGRSALEMSRNCKEVLAIDYSKKFIEAANELLRVGFLEFERKDEGALRTRLRAELPEGVIAEQVSFEVGDAMNLKNGIGVFDRVHAANLLCRLREPNLLLDRLPELVKSGGELVLATPCTWLEQFTPRDRWPKGKTLDWLKESLGKDFVLKREQDEPFLIRETSRKFQWTRSMVTVWEKI